MPSKPSTPQRARTSAPLPSRSTPRHNHGWVDLPCGKRCWFSLVPRYDEDLRNYIDIMDAFGQDTPKTFKHILFWEADRSTANESSTSSKAGDPESYITAIIAEDLTVAYPNSQIVRIYYNGDIPEAKYGTCSDPGTFDLKPRMWNVIEESGDVPLVVSPPLVQKPLTLMTNTTGGVTTTRVATMTHTYAAPQTAVEPYVNATTQPHPTIKPNFTAQIPRKPTSNNNPTWAQVVTKGGAGPDNRI